MNSKNINIIIILLIIIAFISRFSNIVSFYSETDDQLSISQLIKYDDLDFYDLANDTISPTYDGKIKSLIRELEAKKNPLIDKSQKILSNILFNLTPSKHSTFAPLQYFFFGWTINKDMNYNELKFYGRLPSVIFSFLTIFITFKICNKYVFKNNFSLIPVTLVIFSLPMIYISQRSYNYSAATFTIIFLIYLFLKEIDFNNNKRFLKDNKIDLISNIKFSLIVSIQAYLSYISLILLPSFFVLKLISNYFKEKKLLSYNNFNLTISGIIITIIATPLLLHMISINLQSYGMTESTAGNNWEYAIKNIDSSFLNYLTFFCKNFYLIISKNISFFIDNIIGIYILQPILFTIVIVGIFSSILSNNFAYKKIILLFLLMLLNWIILVFLNISAFGPTRHLLIFTPIIAILFTIGLEVVFKKIFKKTDENYLVIASIFLFTIFFSFNFFHFSKLYKDSFSEEKLVKIINEKNVGLIINDGTYSDVICLMKSIKIKISSCPIRYSRHNNIYNFNDDNFKKLKDNFKSMMIVNYDLNPELIKMIKKYNFKKTFEIEFIKFYDNSPLIISKYVPNYLKLYVYK